MKGKEEDGEKRIVRYFRMGRMVEQRVGGFDRHRTQTEDRYLKTRQTRAEFGMCTLVSKALYKALDPYLRLLPGYYYYNVIQKKVQDIKECDVNSPRGERSFSKGLETPEGAMLMKNFEVSHEGGVHRTLFARVTTDIQMGICTIHDFEPWKHLHLPRGEDFGGMQFVLVRIDNETGEWSSSCSEVAEFDASDRVKGYLPGSRVKGQNIKLKAKLPEGTGLLVGLLFVGVYDLDLGKQRFFVNGANALDVVGWGR